MGLRERKRARTRQRITSVAYCLFTEHGYDDTTVEMIAAEADVSARTFYRYFESKDGVLAEGGFQVIDRALERIGDDRSVESLVATMARVYDELVAEDHFREYAALLRRNPKVADRAPTWRARWGGHLAERLAEDDGAAAPTLQHRVSSAAVVNVVTTAVDEWLYRDQQASICDLAAETVAALRSSLTGDDRG